MKTLYVLRHAKAERDSDTGKDFDRPLAERGWSDAELVGREVRAQGFEIDAVLASPARRAAETVEAFARGYGEMAAEWEPGIYNASLDRLLEIVGDADDSVERLLIVGHNPGFEMLVLSLAGHGALVDGFPTAGLVAIDLPMNQWSDLREGTGKLSGLILPRDIR